MQAGHNKTTNNNNISTKDSTAHDVNMFKISLFRHITTEDASSPVATTNQDPFELPPNTVLLVGGLGDCKRAWVKKAFIQFGKVRYLELLKSAWPVHGYVSYASRDSARKAVEKQQQVGLTNN